MCRTHPKLLFFISENKACAVSCMFLCCSCGNDDATHSARNGEDEAQVRMLCEHLSSWSKPVAAWRENTFEINLRRVVKSQGSCQFSESSQ